MRDLIIAPALFALLTFTTPLGIPDPSAAPSAQTALGRMEQAAGARPGLHDFDFLEGSWRIHNRRLKKRLASNHEWFEFEGTLTMRKLMNGYGNVDDTVFYMPSEIYRGVGLRSFDLKTGQWSIWWLDARSPRAPLDPPVTGSFTSGLGTFYADTSFEGRPIRMRFIWSKITPASCHWEQAFSADNGATWETNWIQELTRTGSNRATSEGS